MKVLKVIVGEVDTVEEQYVVVNLADQGLQTSSLFDSIHDFLRILTCPKDVSWRDPSALADLLRS